MSVLVALIFIAGGILCLGVGLIEDRIHWCMAGILFLALAVIALP